jgi:hypothetical protein
VYIPAAYNGQHVYSARVGGNFALEDDIGMHGVAGVEARPCVRVTNRMPLGCPLSVTSVAINYTATLKGWHTQRAHCNADHEPCHCLMTSHTTEGLAYAAGALKWGMTPVIVCGIV